MTTISEATAHAISIINTNMWIYDEISRMVDHVEDPTDPAQINLLSEGIEDLLVRENIDVDHEYIDHEVLARQFLKNDVTERP